MTIGVLGVAGAGTMGAGIAQLACLGGYQTRLWDPVPEALAAGAERLRADLGRGAERERWSAAQAEAAAGRLSTGLLARRAGGLRSGDRGRPRGPRPEARALRPARGGLRAGRGAGHEHLLALGDRDRGRGRAARADLRDALLQSPGADEAGRSRRRRGDRRAGPGDRDRGQPSGWAAPRSAVATPPASWSIAATARSCSSRCGSSTRGSPATPRSTGCCARTAATGWGRSSSWT